MRRPPRRPSRRARAAAFSAMRPDVRRRHEPSAETQDVALRREAGNAAITAAGRIVTGGRPDAADYLTKTEAALLADVMAMAASRVLIIAHQEGAVDARALADDIRRFVDRKLAAAAGAPEG